MHPIILLHGALGTQNDLAPLKGKLEEKGHTVYSFDFPGHGEKSQTIDPDEFRILTFAKALQNFIQEKTPEGAHLFGYSMGGHVATYTYTKLNEKKILSITCYATKWNWAPKASEQLIQNLSLDFLKEKSPTFLQNLNKIHGPNYENLILNTQKMMGQLDEIDGIKNDELKKISIPVLLIKGAEDRVITDEETYNTAQMIPNSKILNIPNSRHEFHRTNIDALYSGFETHILH